MALIDQAIAQHQRGNLIEAEVLYKNILDADPKHFDALHMLGIIHAQRGSFQEAERIFHKALSVDQKVVPCLHNYGTVLAKLKRFDAAIESYNAAIRLAPNHAPLYLDRGHSLNELKRFDEAIAAYNQALALNPTFADAWLGLGNSLYALNRDGDALICYDKSISLNRGDAEAYFGKSCLKLSLGYYDEGWALYEWRWKSKYFSSPVRNFSKPLWLGNSSIAGKTILVHAEQGFGDTIQFYRYLAKLKALGCEIIFEAQAQLVPLIKAQKDNYRIVSHGETLPNFDVHCPLLSLPLAFKTTLETIPASVPYLSPAPEKLELWRARLGKKDKPRIGLAWSGRLMPDYRRSIALESLLPILNEKVEWHSLQKDLWESDRNSLDSSPAIKDYGAYLNDFSDTAALIAQMDLVISIDTAVAHLAGALAKPIWILLQFHPDFRWLRDRKDNPWYPTARLFRQTKDGKWGDVIQRILEELNVFFAAL